MTAWERLDAVRELLHAGHLDQARARADQLRLEQVDQAEPDFLVRLDVVWALIEFEREADLEPVLAFLDQRIASVEISAPALQASVRGQQALLCLRAGDDTRALDFFAQAARQLGSADPADQIAVLMNRSALLMERGDLAGAAADLEQCHQVARAADLPIPAAQAGHNLGYVAFLQGHIPRALRLMRDSLEAMPERHPIGLLDLARVLAEAGLLEEAASHLAEAGEQFEREGLAQDWAEAQFSLAQCLSFLGEAARAEATAERALSVFESRRNQPWVLKARLFLLGLQVRSAAGDAVLLEEAQQAFVIAEQLGRRDLATTARLLACEAEVVGPHPPPEPPNLPDLTDASILMRLHAQRILTMSSARRGHQRRAQEEVRTGLAMLQDLQHASASLDVRTALATHGADLAELGFRLAIGTGDPLEILAAMEQRRGLVSALPRVVAPTDPAAASWLAELRQIEEALRDPTVLDVSGALVEQAALLRDRLRKLSWQQGATGSRTPDLAQSWTAQQIGVAQGEAVLAIDRLDGRYVAVLLTESSRRWLELGSQAAVDPLLQRISADLTAVALVGVPEVMRRAVLAGLGEAMERLDHLLLAAVPPGLRLTVSCHGSLLHAPWSALPSRRGLPTSVARGLQSWARGRRPAPVVGGSEVAILRGPDLVFAKAETDAVAKCWEVPAPEREHSGQETLRALGSRRLVHLAAHGRHQADNPLFSSLRMQDGDLFAYELESLPSLPELVVLSACDVGSSTERRGGEGLGFAAGLLHLGAHAVVAAVNPVNDQQTQQLMATFHAGLAQGRDCEESLALAIQEEAGDIGRVVTCTFNCFR